MFEAILNNLVAIAFTALVALIAPFLVAAAAKVAKRFGLELSETQQGAVGRIAIEGIMLAEEQARNWFMRFSQKMPSDQKLAAAVEYVLDKVPGVTTEEARAIVTAKLPEARALLASFLAEVKRAAAA